MAVRIRLRRIGKKKQPQYRLVAAETAGPRDGRFIEVIGHYNPRTEPSVVNVNQERALHWLNQGAQPSDTARTILMKAGVWDRFVEGRAAARAAREAEPELAPGEEEPGLSGETSEESPQ